MKNTLFLFLATCGLSAGMYANQSGTADFTQEKIQIIATPGRFDIQTGEGVIYNGIYGNSWLMHSPAESFIRVNFEKNENENGKAILSLVHLSSVVGDVAYSPITICVNNTVIAKAFSPKLSNYTTDTFDITSALVNGGNVITISLDDDAPCSYWIQGLSVDIVGDIL